jgi:hypothetical protein
MPDQNGIQPGEAITLPEHRDAQPARSTAYSTAYSTCVTETDASLVNIKNVSVSRR